MLFSCDIYTRLIIPIIRCQIDSIELFKLFTMDSLPCSLNDDQSCLFSSYPTCLKGWKGCYIYYYYLTRIYCSLPSVFSLQPQPVLNLLYISLEFPKNQQIFAPAHLLMLQPPFVPYSPILWSVNTAVALDVLLTLVWSYCCIGEHSNNANTQCQTNKF
jgi:hypothetical protein